MLRFCKRLSLVRNLDEWTALVRIARQETALAMYLIMTDRPRGGARMYVKLTLCECMQTMVEEARSGKEDDAAPLFRRSSRRTFFGVAY